MKTSSWFKTMAAAAVAAFTFGFAPKAQAAETVEYREPVYKTAGEPKSGIDHWETKSVTEYTVVASDQTAWNAGCYVVKGNVEMSSGVTVSGDVKLILTDGCLMTVQGTGAAAGICVSGSGNALTIYGQSAGTGTLRASALGGSGQSGAGIGGNSSSEGSNITINGGTVTANGGFRSAGIGGGKGCGGSNITINGGTVTAKGDGEAAGIGGGLSGTGSNITINGGTVTATGGTAGGCAGIGGGRDSNGEYITINDGMVTATGGKQGSGIGGGSRGAGSNITINGGTVTATAGDSSSQNGAGIGGGYQGAASYITISGGTVTATGGKYGAGIGGGFSGAGSNITISGGMVTATGGLYGAGIGGGGTGAGSNITIDGGTVTAGGIAGSYGSGAGIGGGLGGKGSDIEIGQNAAVYVHGDAELIGSGAVGDAGSGNSIAAGAKVFFNLAGTDMPASFEGFTIMTPETPEESVLVGGIANWPTGTSFNLTNAVSGATGTITVNGNPVEFANKILKLLHDTTAQTLKLTVEAKPVSYLEPVYVGGVVTNGIDHWETNKVSTYTEVTSDMTTWGAAGETNWYVVAGNVTIGSRITCYGDVRLILKDNATLNVSMGIIASPGTNGYLGFAVYAQSEGSSMGVLNATGDGYAGIGGSNGAGSNITINGGKVTATSGNGAGIGGGTSGAGYNIVINGGTVTATARGAGGAGIGGGTSGAGYNIVINGGTVTATGVIDGAGIGGGNGAAGEHITINGGKVTATGSSSTFAAAGIGGGGGAAGRYITISGGEVEATGVGQQACGAGIGGGAGEGAYITISGGNVTARGATGIGGGGIDTTASGSGSAGHHITISGGTVTAISIGNASIPGCCAGIGGSCSPNGGGAGSYITISGGTVTACGMGSPGIGAGGSFTTWIPGDGSHISITGGTVYVSGGGGGMEPFPLIGGNSSSSDNVVSADAKVFFNLSGTDMPTSFQSMTIMTPETQTDERVLVTGIAAWPEAVGTFNLTNVVTAATRTLKVNGDSGGFAGALLAISHKDSVLKLTAGPATLYDIAVTTTPEGSGTVTSDPSDQEAKDKTVTLTVTPSAGYALDTISVVGATTTLKPTEVEPGKTYTFEMPAEAVTVTATFKVTAVPHDINIESSTGGEVTSNVASTNEGAVVTLTISPYAPLYHYVDESLTIIDEDGNYVTPTEVTKGQTYTFEMPGTNVLVTAQFEVNGTQVGDNVYAIVTGSTCMLLGTGATWDYKQCTNDLKNVTTVSIGDGITHVGSRFFKKAYNLQSVTGGKDLTSVGESAFYLCTRLETITLSCAKAPEGMAGAVVSRTAIKPSGEPYVIPAVTPGYEQVLFGKAALTDEWKDLGSPEGKSIYDQGDNMFFKVDQVPEK